MATSFTSFQSVKCRMVATANTCRSRSMLQTPGLFDIDPRPPHSRCGAKLMAINHYRNRHQNPLENDPSTPRSNTDKGRRLKVIRNHAYDPPAPAADDKGGRSLPAESQGEVNGAENHSRTAASVRRPYLKPAFQHEVVFSRVLMQRSPPRIGPSAT